MKITKEQIENLNQLDRIEYKLKLIEIDNSHDSVWSWISTWIRYYIFFAFIGLAFYYSTYAHASELAISMFSIAGWVTIAFIIGAVIDYFTAKKKYEKLQNKYFKVSKRR